MNQLVLGAAVPFGIGLLCYLLGGRRATLRLLVLMPAAMGLGALWAVVPDIPRVLGMQELYIRLINDPRCDIFFWHYTIDRAETDAAGFAVLAVLMLVMLPVIAVHELKQREREWNESCRGAGGA